MIAQGKARDRVSGRLPPPWVTVLLIPRPEGTPIIMLDQPESFYKTVDEFLQNQGDQ